MSANWLLALSRTNKYINHSTWRGSLLSYGGQTTERQSWPSLFKQPSKVEKSTCPELYYH